jgi:hypothetical protein
MAADHHLFGADRSQRSQHRDVDVERGQLCERDRFEAVVAGRRRYRRAADGLVQRMERLDVADAARNSRSRGGAA